MPKEEHCLMMLNFAIYCNRAKKLQLAFEGLHTDTIFMLQGRPLFFMSTLTIPREDRRFICSGRIAKNTKAKERNH